MTDPDVRVERADLDAGIPVMYRDTGKRVRMAYDPNQISEDAARALLCLCVPRLAPTLLLVGHGN